MESPPSDQKTAVESPKSPQSPPYDLDQKTQEFASNFTALYHSMFPPKPSPLPASLSLTPSATPNSSSPSSSSAAAAADNDDFFLTAAADGATEHRLHQARLVLEIQELCDQYELSLSRLQAFSDEIELLRQENADLRLANNELLKLLSLSSQAAVHSTNRVTGNRLVMSESNRFERRNNDNNVERVSLPKSISVRSSGYRKLNRTGPSSNASTIPRVPTHLDQLVPGSVQQQQQQQLVYVPGGVGKREEKAVELEVYNQGMWKTELCNKWQETSTCPYGDHCQFAHGINELRPVIRHPRYKTQVCRMVLAGDVCPYAHRCHFRHSLTDQERLLLHPR